MTQRKIYRKSPCPCGSGRKYKKCCMRLEGIPLHPDIKGLMNVMEAETRAQMVDFAEPLLDSARSDPEAREAAWLLSMAYWYAASGGRDFAAAEMARIEQKTCHSKEDRLQARQIARMMFERYEAMRPGSGTDLVSALEEIWGKDLRVGIGGKSWLGRIVSRVRDAL